MVRYTTSDKVKMWKELYETFIHPLKDLTFGGYVFFFMLILLIVLLVDSVLYEYVAFYFVEIVCIYMV